MKQNAILTVLLLAAAPVWAQTVVSTSYTNSTPASIPDGNPVGVTEQFTVSGLGGSVANVQVQLAERRVQRRPVCLPGGSNGTDGGVAESCGRGREQSVWL